MQITVSGEPILDLPKDLYIPPNALLVFIKQFTGPLDLLLYLIKKNNIDILDIPVAQITTQYMEYIMLMKQLQIELASEYLVMAAMLAEIKSRMLLPKHEIDDNQEQDPRAELVRKLREYERYQQVAKELDTLPRMYRDIFPISIDTTTITKQFRRPLPNLDLKELLAAFQNVMLRSKFRIQYNIQRENISVNDRMLFILESLKLKEFVKFEKMFNVLEGRLGVIVSFIAMLELIRQNLICITQSCEYGQIYLKEY